MPNSARLLLPALLLALLLQTSAALADDGFDGYLGDLRNPRQADATWVADEVGVLGDRRAQINAVVDRLERDTSAEIAVVIVHTIGDHVPRDFATALFNHWGVGKRGKDNGVLVLHVLDQRRVEIETGYGAEAALTDAECQWIIDDVAIPFFKAGSLADGHLEIVRALDRGLRNPDATRQALTGSLQATPGQRVDAIPTPTFEQRTRLHQRRLKTNPVPIFLALGGLLLLGLWTLIYFFYRRTRSDPYQRFKFYSVPGSFMHYLGTLGLIMGPTSYELTTNNTFWGLFTVAPTWLGLWIWRKRHLQALRDQPRLCQQCHKPTERLDEEADDEYLEPGQRTEERIKSMDYDVWVCRDCDTQRIDAYRGDTTAYTCSSCGYRTFRVVSTITVRAATYSSSGLERITSRCAHCGLQEVRDRVIPQKTRSSSSSSGGGGFSGGSSGGSFGGGSSGGGGAGGSY